MHDDSLVHRALVMGAIALAFVGGATAFARFEPPPPPPVPTVIVPEEQSQQVAQPTTYRASEPAAGAAPLENYLFTFSGPGFSKTCDVSIPNHLAGSIYLDEAKLSAAGSQEPGMIISYQPTPEAPHIVLNADADHFKSKLGDWLKAPLDFSTLTVDRIEITPARGLPAGGAPTPVLTLAPQTKTESKEPAPEAPISFHQILDELASTLSIAATAAEYIRRRGKSAGSETASKAVKQVRLDHDAVSWTAEDGVPHTVIAMPDLEKLDGTDRQLILTLMASIRRHFTLWTLVYPDRDLSPAAVTQSDELQRSLCGDLSRLKGYIEKTGRQLAGFEAIEVVCQT